jgi:hypothetical protein
VIKQVTVLRSVFTFKFLLNSGQLSEWRRDDSDDNTRDDVPSECQHRSCPSNKLCQFTREENQIKNWLSDIEIKVGKTLSPLVKILSKSLIRVGNSTIQVADLFNG